MFGYKQFVLLPSFETNTWLLWEKDSNEAVLIDPAAHSQHLLDYCLLHSLKMKYIIITHGHADHIGGIDFFKENLHIPVCIHADDADMLTDSRQNLSAYMEYDLSLNSPDKLLNDNDALSLGSHEIKIIHTPGHTRGGICLLAGNLLFSGDTLFRHDIGRTDLPKGSESSLRKSIRTRLYLLPDDTLVLPGHGPSSSIRDEKLNNPYV